LRVEIPAGGDAAARLVEALTGKVETITVGRPTLEDVFFKLTGEPWAAEERS
jgi:hypothetical protein